MRMLNLWRVSSAISALLLVGCGGAQNEGRQAQGLSPNAGTAPNREISAAAADDDILRWVNPFIGTKDGTGRGAIGNTFPGAALPFGMVQFSPDTTYGDEDFAAYGGYGYDRGSLKGMSLTHISGPGCQVAQDLSFFPIVGVIGRSPGTHLDDYQVSYSHTNEKAIPGYYRVGMNNGVNAELTATLRTGLARFQFPSAGTVLLNIGRTGGGAKSAQLELIGDRAFQGAVTTNGICTQEGTKGPYTVYVYGEFDRSFDQFGVYQGDSVSLGVRRVGPAQRNGGWVRFSAGGQVQMRVGVSYVSMANARKNLEAESPGWDFNATRDTAANTWRDQLGKIRVTGGTVAERETFYTALYHTQLHPNVFNDVNGEYIGFDGKTYTAQGWNKYANYSGWDIYRSQIQLVAWLEPKRASDMARSLIVDAQAGGGGLAKWPVANNDSCVMIGDPGAAIVSSVHAFGGRQFDAAAALAVIDVAATKPGLRTSPTNDCLARQDIDRYLAYGFVPVNAWAPGAVTYEYAVADAAIGHFADALGDTVRRDKYLQRAQSWKTLYSNFSDIAHLRREDGVWYEPYNPNVAAGWLEGNASQYVWMVPHNYRGVIDRMGGNEKAIARLDRHFEKLNDGGESQGGYAFMSNEVELWAPWAYNHAGAPYKTQALVRRIMNELFSNKPEGLAGNDDLGAMSAWYLWGALGIYPSIPGLGGFAIASPLFPSVRIMMGNGHTLTINSNGAGADGVYIHGLKVNGQPSTKTWLPLSALNGDTTLEFQLAGTANAGWGTNPSDAPPSFDGPRSSLSQQSFSADFESIFSQPDWNDKVDLDFFTNAKASKNVSGYCCNMDHMESSTRTEKARSGKTALLYSGTDNASEGGSYSYNRIFDVNIPVTSSTRLSYWIHPQSQGSSSTYVAIDLIFHDGTSLRDSGAVDQHGVRVHPESQGKGGRLVSDSWNLVQSDIGGVAAGKTVKRILVGFDRPDSTGNFRGFIDDIQIGQ
ncbi:GH92 family glycosyl hydrolase [Cystobacter fuscus]|uniref:GH92 family glycosyl hydrolase n=1 Tax=Cystobacter fuscus TaxID=43 RepID=UPI0037BFBD8B